MTHEHLIGPFVRRFLLEELVAERYTTHPTRLTIAQLDAALVRSFLVYLEDERGNSSATRNQRLGALHSLFRCIGRLVPELVDHAAPIQAIPLRRTAAPVMPYLDQHQVDALLAVPDRRRAQGRRDYALLLFLYNTGARATEATAVTLADLSLGSSPSLRFHGKGRKIRICPLGSHTAKILSGLLGARLDDPDESPAFLNVRGQPLPRYGVHALVARTVEKAAATVPSLNEKRVRPHTIRHATAVHLLRAGVDLNTIRAWFGHVSCETTNRYAEVDLEMKVQALETCAITDPVPASKATPSWHADSDLMSFLASL